MIWTQIFIPIMLCAMIAIGAGFVRKQNKVVYVVRPTLLGKPFGGNITANDEFVGTTQGTIYVYAVLTPGEYKFKVTGHDNESEIVVKLEADTTYYIYQSVYPGFLKGLTELKLVNKEEGREALEKCTLGDKLGKNIAH